MKTYLYVKRHNITGKLYFGKTIKKDPEKYTGSGRHWSRHIKKHGKEHVETLWYCLFTEKDELVKFALMCSDKWDIVNSSDWLNVIPENGLDGQNPGYSPSIESRQKMSLAKLGKKQPPHSEDHKIRQSLSMKGKIISKETREKISNTLNGTKHSEETCSKISQSLTGKKRAPFTEEHKAKISAARKQMKLNRHEIETTMAKYFC